jgi:large subunit ribosomal protein L10
MNKEQKAAAVEEIAAGLSGAEAIFAIDYRGISVPQAKELRIKLTEADATFTVVKNRLAKRAVEQTGTEGLEALLQGPTALTLIKGDPVIAAKAISTFAREHNVLVFKGGIMDGEPLEPDQFVAIARLPGVEVLHGQLVGLIASPLTGLAAGLNNLISGLGRQLAQIAEQGLVTGEPPAAEEVPEEEAPPADEPAEDASGDEAGEPVEEGAQEEEAPAEEETEAEAPADEESSEEPAAEEETPAEETPAEGETSEEPDPGSDSEPEEAAEPESAEGSDPSGEASEEKETEEEN